jgi:hypothetical protein
MAAGDGPPLCISWTLVFIANLVVPIPLGLKFTEDGGRFGMAVAVVAWWAAGLAICLRRAAWGRLLISGGIVVGFSQFLAVPQVAAGFAALRFWSRVGNMAGDISGEMDGFAVTALTGGQLIALGCAGALLGRALIPRDRGSAEEASRDHSVVEPTA